MKLQAIKKRCKAERMFVIVNDTNGCQWISDNFNYYRIVGIHLEKDYIQDVFALTDKQMDRMIVTTRRRTETFFGEAYPAFGEPVEYIRDIWAYEQVLHAFVCNGAVMYVPEAATKPTNFENVTDLRLVYDDEGKPLIAVYNGAFCDALIAPVQAAIARDISDWLANLGGMPVFGEEEVSAMKKIL